MAGVGEAGVRHDDGAEQTLFAVCVVTIPGRVDVSITGEVDLSTREALVGVLDTACGLEPHVRLDLAGVVFLDPQGAMLLGRRQAGHPHLEVTAASGAVRRIVEILREIEGAGPCLQIAAGTYDAPVS